MNRTITFVSLGPGEPELITLKGLKTLQQAGNADYLRKTGFQSRPYSTGFGDRRRKDPSVCIAHEQRPAKSHRSLRSAFV